MAGCFMIGINDTHTGDVSPCSVRCPTPPQGIPSSPPGHKPHSTLKRRARGDDIYMDMYELSRPHTRPHVHTFTSTSRRSSARQPASLLLSCVGPRWTDPACPCTHDMSMKTDRAAPPMKKHASRKRAREKATQVGSIQSDTDTAHLQDDKNQLR